METVMNSTAEYEPPMLPPGISADALPGLPLSLKVVAGISIAMGTAELASSIIMALHGQLYLNAGVFCIPAGIGLLRRRPGWRSFSLVINLIWLLMCPVIMVTFLVKDAPLKLTVFGRTFRDVPDAQGVLFAVCLFFCFLWQYRTLLRKDVREAFGIRPRSVSRTFGIG